MADQNPHHHPCTELTDRAPKSSGFSGLGAYHAVHARDLCAATDMYAASA